MSTINDNSDEEVVHILANLKTLIKGTTSEANTIEGEGNDNHQKQNNDYIDESSLHSISTCSNNQSSLKDANDQPPQIHRKDDNSTPNGRSKNYPKRQRNRKRIGKDNLIVNSNTSGTSNVVSSARANTYRSNNEDVSFITLASSTPSKYTFIKRILKGDFRRELARMWINSLNSQDSDLIHSFLRTFCIDACEHRHDILQEHALALYDQSDLVHGIVGVENIALRILSKLLLHPDAIFSIKQVRIRQSSSLAGLVVELDYILRATKIVYKDESNGNDINNNNNMNKSDRSNDNNRNRNSPQIFSDNCIANSNQNDLNNNYPNSLPDSQPIEYSFQTSQQQQMYQPSVRFRQFIDIEASKTLHIHLNAQNQIFLFHLFDRRFEISDGQRTAIYK